jgi:hypothetical protein
MPGYGDLNYKKMNTVLLLYLGVFDELGVSDDLGVEGLGAVQLVLHHLCCYNTGIRTEHVNQLALTHTHEN